jgi:tetratricopeptide (TPR) repeat protein
MKSLLLFGTFNLIILIFLPSCSSKKEQSKDKNIYSNAFENESYHRILLYSSKEMHTLNHTFNVCYQGSIDEALKVFEKKFKTLKDHSFYYNHIAHCFYMKKDFPKAIFFSKYVLSSGRNKIEKSSSLNLLGMIYFIQNRFGLSLNSFNQGLEMNPESKVLRYNLALIHLRLNQPREAINLINPLKENKDPLILYTLGLAYTMSKTLTEAEKVFSKIPDEEMKKPDRLLTYSGFFYLSNYLNQAKKTLAPIVSDKANPHQPDSLILLKLIKSKELSLQTEKISK